MTTRHTRSDALRLLFAAPLVAVALAGCSIDGSVGSGAAGSDTPEPIISEPIDNSAPHNAAIISALEELQQEVWNGDWKPAVGGNVLEPCDASSGGNDFLFYGSWFTTDGFTAPEDPETTAQELSSWLEAEGWSDVGVDSSGSSDSAQFWRVWGTHEDASVAEAVVTWYPEGSLDSPDPHAVLDLDSTCSPADTQD